MEVIERGERYEKIDGDFQFACTIVVYREGNKIFHANTQARLKSTADIKATDLSNIVLIPAAAHCPLFSSNYTRATDPLPSGCFVKKTSLKYYDPTWNTSKLSPICRRVLKEVDACEVIRSKPHPNLAEYLGCQVQDGRITGICYTKYNDTLMHRVNPGHYMKRAVVYEGTDSTMLADSLDEVKKGLLHLHSLGIVHNDINPSNIMFKGDKGDTPVIIDFDSCRPLGENLGQVGRTYEWYDESVQTSEPSNDLNALSEIREWLKIGGSKIFKFEV